MRFTLAIKEQITSLAYQWREIISPISALTLRQTLCESVLIEALDYEHKLFEEILISFHTVKTRRAAGKNFDKWIIKKMNDMKNELTSIKVFKTQTTTIMGSIFMK